MSGKLLYFFIAVSLMSLPKGIFGQAPDLGAASDFALFTAVGALDNTGVSTVTGDVGSNTYAATGFPPGTVVGTIYNPPDPKLAQAATDVINAYTYLSTLGGSVLGVGLGNGQILTPGVYNTGAASTLNGNLILDGQNDPDAVFIIRIGGAFATGGSSTVTLIDSASACNVYWQIGGQFDLGDGSIFRGTSIVDGAINLVGTSYLNGRALSKGGAISLVANTVNFLPAAAGTVSGTAVVCQGQTGVIFSVPAIANATSYSWTIPSGATITSGANSNSITVDFSISSVSGNITVQGINSCGTGTVSATYAVTVNYLPITSLIWHF
jgi:hypothetical protein